MKTHVIQLELHDDVVFIRDKMSWAKTARILLIWPARARVDIRPLDLKLLQRHAAALGAQVGLVTRDGGSSAPHKRWDSRSSRPLLSLTANPGA